MKATTKKRITIGTAIIFGIMATVLLSSFIAFKGRKLKRPVQNEEVIEYVKINILPVLKEKRANFDQFLSDDEKQKVSELQLRLQILHNEKMKSSPQGLRLGNFNRGDRPEISDEQREKIRAHMKERRLIMTEAWAIADNHESEIESVLEDLKPDMEKWREDIRKIREPYREQRQELREEWRNNREQRRNEFRDEGYGRGSGRHYGKRGMDFGSHRGYGMMGQYTSPPMFVLFEAENALNLLDDLESRAAIVFPNPTEGTATIKFKLSQPEKVVISIYDNQGNLISKVLDQQKDAGDHELAIDISNYDTGLYFYEIITGTSSQKGRIIKR
jgi:hypothetical protein